MSCTHINTGIQDSDHFGGIKKHAGDASERSDRSCLTQSNADPQLHMPGPILNGAMQKHTCVIKV